MQVTEVTLQSAISSPHRIATKTPAVLHDFWLVSTFEVIKVDVENETTTAKVFTKWQFQDPGGMEDLDASSLEKRIKIPEHASPEEIVKCLKEGKELKGARLVTNESNHFPVNPSMIFLNQLTELNEYPALSWVKYHSESKTVSYQIVFEVTVYSPFALHQYPFDRHVIPFRLATRSWRDEDKVKHHWQLCAETPEWAQCKFSEDKSVISENLARIDHEDEMDHMLPCFYMDPKDKKPVLCIRLERSPTYFCLSVTIPIWAIVTLCMGFFFLEFNNASERANGIIISVLIMTAFKSSIQDQLPKKTYMTSADWYLNFGFIFCLCLFAKTVETFHTFSTGVGFFEDYDHSWYRIMEGNTLRVYSHEQYARYQTNDDIGSWALFISWQLLHSVIFTDALVRKCGTGATGILDKLCRPSWKKVFSRALNQKSTDRAEYKLPNPQGKETTVHCFNALGDPPAHSHLWTCNCTSG